MIFSYVNEMIKLQYEPKLQHVRQCPQVFTPKQNLTIWVHKKDVIFYYVKTNNFYMSCAMDGS
jgi:hypothetical protein